MVFALVKNGICVNTIEADQNFIDTVISPQGIYDLIVDCSSLIKYGAGQFWTGKEFLDIQDAVSAGLLASAGATKTVS